MDYKEKYNAALERAKEVLLTSTTYQMFVIQEIFPELAESKDEKIKKELISLVNYTKGRRIGYEPRITQDEMIAWLDKQDANKEYVFRPVAGTMIENAVEQALKQGNVVLAFNGFYTPVKGKTSDEILAEYDCWIDKQSENKHNFSNIRIWKYIVDTVLTEENGIGQYIDSPDTERIAKKLQEKYGNIKKHGEKPKEVTCTHEVETGNGNIKAMVTEKIQLP